MLTLERINDIMNGVNITQQITGNTCYHKYLARTNAYVDLNHQKYCWDCNDTEHCQSQVTDLHFVPIVRFEIPLVNLRFK